MDLNPLNYNYEERPVVDLRDYFAAKALQGLLADTTLVVLDWADYARKSYHIADAMMEARKK